MKKLTHAQVMTSEILLAYAGKLGTAGRVVSGLLGAAVKSGALTKERTTGHVIGTTVFYVGPDEAFDAIRAQAISRAI